jgi:hypothetical protein
MSVDRKRPVSKLKYIGRGSFIPGVPSRDLSAAEVKLFGGMEYLIGSGLYVETKRRLRLQSPTDQDEFDR